MSRSLKIISACWAPLFVMVSMAWLLGGVEAAKVMGWICAWLYMGLGAVLFAQAMRTRRADKKAFDKLLG